MSQIVPGPNQVIKYIGRTTFYKGKTLWELLGNLKGGGVGRIVARSIWDYYPERSYMKVLSVEALPNDRPRKIKVMVEKVFRGIKCEKTFLVQRSTYKADFKLIPKDEEEEYCKITKVHIPTKIPPYAELPPLMKELILRDCKRKGIQPPENLRLTLKIHHSKNNRCVKQTPEECDEIIPIGIGLPDRPMYRNVKPVEALN